MTIHDPRRPFCPCDECEAKRAIVRYDAKRDAIDKGLNPIAYNFNARQLGQLLELSLNYAKGLLD